MQNCRTGSDRFLMEILISKTVFLKWLYNDAVYTSAPIRINTTLLA